MPLYTPSPVGLLPGSGSAGRWRRGNIMLGRGAGASFYIGLALSGFLMAAG